MIDIKHKFLVFYVKFPRILGITVSNIRFAGFHELKNHEIWILPKIIRNDFFDNSSVQNEDFDQFYRFLALIFNFGSNCKSLRLLNCILLKKSILAYFTNRTHKWNIWSKLQVVGPKMFFLRKYRSWRIFFAVMNLMKL